MSIQNHRQPGESAVAYRHRRREVNKLIGRYLKTGVPATHSRETFDGKPRPYVVGPHKTHKPHPVEQHGTVMHPGTLVKGLPA